MDGRLPIILVVISGVIIRGDEMGRLTFRGQGCSSVRKRFNYRTDLDLKSLRNGEQEGGILSLPSEA